ncbi:hypothetical protein P8C59_006124 [Phyllachora maydis]|uniref:Uncharacterized protein n=1 Tax=Phyllachora maydis TaxID=1825666 RepID=A0AAD9I728_9PEZI|nr:hypothetical protein P8C59_006124 [Phyllachora maydis]
MHHPNVSPIEVDITTYLYLPIQTAAIQLALQSVLSSTRHMQHRVAQSSDLPWLIGAIAVTWLLAGLRDEALDAEAWLDIWTDIFAHALVRKISSCHEVPLNLLS